MNTFPAIAGALALLLAAPPQAGARTLHAERSHQKTTLRTYIATIRSQTWRYQDRAGAARWPTRYLERRGSERYLNYLARMWRHRMKAAHSAYQRASALPAHYRDWLCIHRYEGAWTDAGAPYWGGVQFGYSEWQRYGAPYTGAVTANLATPLQQMWAAERYYHDAGFRPWPNTARACGLL